MHANSAGAFNLAHVFGGDGRVEIDFHVANNARSLMICQLRFVQKIMLTAFARRAIVRTNKGDRAMNELRRLLSEALAVANRHGDNETKSTLMRGFNAVRGVEKKS